MTLNETILRGLKGGVNRHWTYTKDLFRVKPEYLLTVSVADEIANNGFGEKSGLDLALKLEEPTYLTVGHLWMHGAGFRHFFKKRTKWLGRKGKVDILIQHESGNECHIIELKNFDPSVPEVQKELLRFKHFIDINGRVNPLKSCHLAFPTKTKKHSWLEQQGKFLTSLGLLVSVESWYEETGEDPEDGIPVYYCNVISVTKPLAELDR
jgi:hypothetical protein